MSSPDDKKMRRSFMFSALCIAGISLIIIGVSVIYLCDPSKFDFYPRCLFHDITGLYCPGCGSLRAFHQLLHGNIRTAFSYNPLFVVFVPVSVVFAALYMNSSSRKMFESRLWIWLFLIIVICYWILRNIPAYPFDYLKP